MSLVCRWINRDALILTCLMSLSLVFRHSFVRSFIFRPLFGFALSYSGPLFLNNPQLALVLRFGVATQADTAELT